MKFLLCTFIIVTFLFSVIIINAQNIVINEFMADNNTTIQDKDGEFSDWIELYNISTTPINLFNYSLSDNIHDLDKWKFPAIFIPAHSYLLIFASGKEKKDIKELHTNFKIASNGEKLFLSNNNGQLIDQTEAIELADDEVYGRLLDGEDNWFKLSTPTPRSSNNINNQLFFSQKGGFYTSPFQLKISSYLGDSIFYTLNGDIPTEKSNLLDDSLYLTYKYHSPNVFSEIPTTPPQSLITYKAWEPPKKIIDKANILRCASFRNGKRTSKIYTQTFFVDSLIFEKYKLPIISLITDSLNFFSNDSGIYVPGKNYDSTLSEWTGNYFHTGDEWERAIHIEYYESSGKFGFSQDAGVKIHGGKTRHASQKTLRLYARNEYKKNILIINYYLNAKIIDISVFYLEQQWVHGEGKQ